jgi:iron complex transport system substrate-binding protein
LRVVSLLASATEIVCALGAGEFLVGRSHECDNPSWVRSLPQLSEPTFDISMSSAEIDREVTRRIRRGEPLYRIHTQAIEELRPDVIFAQSHCQVCAVTPGDVERDQTCLRGVRMVSLSASSLDGVFESILQVGDALGLASRAYELMAGERAQLHRLQTATAPLRRPSIAVLEWLDPMFPMGNWGPELVEAAGAELLLGNRAQHSFAIPAEQLQAADPEYIVIAPCGFHLERTIEEWPVLEQHLWWGGLGAVSNGKVALADGNLFFNRSGTTVVRSAEILAEIVHGLVSGESTEGRHWLWTPRSQATRTSAA